MKVQSDLLLTVFMILYCSCTKEEKTSEQFWGNSSVLVNDSLFSFSPYAKKSVDVRDKMNIVFAFFNSEGNLEQLLTFNFIPMQTGNFVLHPYVIGLNIDSLSQTSFETYKNGGHSPGALYKVFEHSSIENNLELNYFDSTSGEVKGTFNVVFIRDTSYAGFDNRFADTLVFRDGQFHTKIIH